MAGQIINVTRSIVTLAHPTAVPNTSQSGIDAVDLLGYPGARYDFCLKVFALTGTSIQVSLYSSMYNDDNKDNWTIVGTAFGTVSAPNLTRTLGASTGVLRYIRWDAVVAGVTLVSFEVLGVAR